MIEQHASDSDSAIVEACYRQKLGERGIAEGLDGRARVDDLVHDAENGPILLRLRGRGDLTRPLAR